MRLSQRLKAVLTTLDAEAADLWVVCASERIEMEPGLRGLHVPDASRIIDGASGLGILINDRCGLDWPGLLGVSIHEFAHVVTLGPWTMQTSPDAVKAYVAGCTERWDPVAAGVPPWCGHDLRFLRTCVHLLHRAQQAGHKLEPDSIVTGEWYGLSPFAAYVESLGLEPKCWEGIPLRTVLTSDPPSRFTALWQQDVERHDSERKSA